MLANPHSNHCHRAANGANTVIRDMLRTPSACTTQWSAPHLTLTRGGDHLPPTPYPQGVAQGSTSFVPSSQERPPLFFASLLLVLLFLVVLVVLLHLVHHNIGGVIGGHRQLHLGSLLDVVPLVGLRQFAHNLPLDFMLDGAHTKPEVVCLDENILNILVPIQLDLVSLVCCGLPPEQLLPGQSAQLLRCEWQEEQNFIDTSNELIALEVLLQQWQNGLLAEIFAEGLWGRWVITIFHFGTGPDSLIGNFPLGQIAGHHKDGVHTFNKFPLPVCQPALIEGLQEAGQDVGMGLLHFIEQYNGIGAAAQSLGQLPTIVISSITWRGSNELGHLVLILVLCHIDPDEAFSVALVHVFRRLFGELCLPNTRASHEQEHKRVIGRVPAILLAPDLARHREDGIFLSHKTLLQTFFQRELLPLFFVAVFVATLWIHTKKSAVGLFSILHAQRFTCLCEHVERADLCTVAHGVHVWPGVPEKPKELHGFGKAGRRSIGDDEPGDLIRLIIGYLLGMIQRPFIWFVGNANVGPRIHSGCYRRAVGCAAEAATCEASCADVVERTVTGCGGD
mmetsp:Transcript_48077/g.79146  ORF Transcript_48077/g.79146 Transcript_48077/m.79146 type:complete len:564 (-) Transcript_48077:163-1854(-)